VIGKETPDDSGEAKPKKIKLVYTIRDIIKQQYRELVNEEIPYKPTDKEYIGSYQRAVTTVLKNMTKDQLGEAEKMVEVWNEQGAPLPFQLK
jgi:hypothetical protein